MSETSGRAETLQRQFAASREERRRLIGFVEVLDTTGLINQGYSHDFEEHQAARLQAARDIALAEEGECQ